MSMLTGVELLEGCIRRVWSEHDDARRRAAMEELYRPDAVIYEPSRSVSGHQEISDVVQGVLKDMPEGFRFEIVGPSLEHHGIAITRWTGMVGSVVTVSGSDVARITDGQISEHYFFFDPEP